MGVVPVLVLCQGQPRLLDCYQLSLSLRNRRQVRQVNKPPDVQETLAVLYLYVMRHSPKESTVRVDNLAAYEQLTDLEVLLGGGEVLPEHVLLECSPLQPGILHLHLL